MQKHILTLCLAVLGAWVSVQAQPINRATPEAMQKAAEEAEATNNPYAALEFYEKIYDDTKDKMIAAKVGKLNYEVRDYAAAEKWMSRLVLRDRKAEFTELKYWYAMSLKANGKHQEAIDYFNQYISEGADAKLKADSKVQIAGSEMARKAKTPDNLIIANGGKKINSPQTEGSPVYNSGELYFSSLKAKEIITLDGKEGDWYAKIFTASRASGSEFSDPQPLNTEINREGFHQGNVSITADGKTMFFTRVETENMGLKSSKIYYSKKGSDGWGPAYEVTGVNGDYLAKHPCEGELFGEKVLFFSANIPGNKGGFDLYYASKKTDGVYALPTPLSDVVNTAGDEVSPFYRDGKLYFSSNGLPSMGGFDVYETQWNGSVWSAAKNIGGGINSTLDDMYYTQSNDGMSGYFVSNRPGPNNLKSKTCCDDIYAWEIERIKVNLTALTFRLPVKTDKDKQQQPLTECTVAIQDVTDKNPANVDQKTNTAANNFDFELLPEKKYVVIATREGFIPDTVSFNTVGIKKTTKIEKKLTLRRVKKEPVTRVIRKNEPIVLKNILYDFDKDNIRPDAEPDLQYLTDIMTKNPAIKIELSSHTDSRGKDEYNQDLSQRRAQSAVNWIIAKGISADRLVAKGYGETKLVNGCSNGVTCTEEEHQANRRTEFKIIEGPTEITIEVQEDVKASGQPAGGKNSVRPVFFYEH